MDDGECCINRDLVVGRVTESGWVADTFNAEKTGEDGEEEEGRGGEVQKAEGLGNLHCYYAWNFSRDPKISVGLPSVKHITKV